jgi:hypothetical protein
MTKGDNTMMDLATWGRGETDAPFPEVRDAIKARLGKVVKDQSDAVLALVEAGIVGPGKVRLDVGLEGAEAELWRLLLVGEGLIPAGEKRAP